MAKDKIGMRIDIVISMISTLLTWHVAFSCKVGIKNKTYN